MAKKVVTALESLRVEEIFNKKGWEKKENEKISLYENYLNRLSLLPTDTRDLFFDLTDNFENITFNDIIQRIKDSYNLIDHDYINKFRKIYFMPLIEQIPIYENKSRYKIFNWIYRVLGTNKKTYKERPERKSGERLLSLFEIEYRELFGAEKFIFPKSYSKFKEQFSNKDLIILVDDYVGTGDTAKDVLNFYLKYEKFNKKNVLILSIAAQFHGINRVKEEFGVRIISKIERGKYLVDNFSDDILKEKRDKIATMCEALKIKNDYFGYGDSEALICILNKSPNNTFPVFWYETKSYPAPFPRSKVYKNFNKTKL